jgi:hypothetical protein
MKRLAERGDLEEAISISSQKNERISIAKRRATDLRLPISYIHGSSQVTLAAVREKGRERRNFHHYALLVLLSSRPYVLELLMGW